VFVVGGSTQADHHQSLLYRVRTQTVKCFTHTQPGCVWFLRPCRAGTHTVRRFNHTQPGLLCFALCRVYSCLLGSRRPLLTTVYSWQHLRLSARHIRFQQPGRTSLFFRWRSYSARIRAFICYQEISRGVGVGSFHLLTWTIAVFACPGTWEELRRASSVCDNGQCVKLCWQIIFLCWSLHSLTTAC
jgi:hypothetical protein